MTPSDVKVTGNNVANRGNDITFTCSSNGGPNNYYQWLVNNTVLPGENSTTLHLEQVDASFGGRYTCLVTNRAGNDSFSVILYVKPYISVHPPMNLEVELSDPAISTCDGDGYPAPVLSWTTWPIGVFISMNGTLAIPSVTTEDSGIYRCRAFARNQKGLYVWFAIAEMRLIGTFQGSVYIMYYNLVTFF